MSLRNALHWFSEASRPPYITGKGKNRKTVSYRGPVLGAIILKNGTLVKFDYRVYADRQRAQVTYDQYAGHVISHGDDRGWFGNAPNPFWPDCSVQTPRDVTYATAEEAAVATLQVVADTKAAEEAVRNEPAVWLDRELKNHDWFVAYSDAPGVCGAADRHWRDTILPLKEKVSPEVWSSLFNKHAPAECKGMGTVTPKYLVYWDNGNGACGTFPQEFDSPDAADAFGKEWVKEADRETRLDPESEEGHYYEVMLKG